MALRFTLTRILPTLLLFLALIATAIFLDYLLHLLGLDWIGRYCGLVGTALILTSFIYSMRKRKWIASGSMKGLLKSHETLGWLGALVVLVHGGIHFYALIPWLALSAMLVVVASGLTGRFLLEEAQIRIKGKSDEMRKAGRSAADIESELIGQSLLVGTMKQWRQVHMPLTMVFLALSLLHITATALFWRW